MFIAIVLAGFIALQAAVITVMFRDARRTDELTRLEPGEERLTLENCTRCNPPDEKD